MPVKTVRSIIEIDEDKCDGCGLCVPACKEGAIQILDGKARLVQDRYCDGLGACLGECPRGAISITEREADEFDESAAVQHVRRRQSHQPAAPCGCPSAHAISLEVPHAELGASAPPSLQPQLRNWPVQLTLVPVGAPWLEGADLLISADCVPFAYPDLHGGLLAGRQLIIACPKLDDAAAYVDKLAAIFQRHDIRSVTIARMEVPCCGGLHMIVAQALQAAGRNIPVHAVVVGINGDLLERT